MITEILQSLAKYYAIALGLSFLTSLFLCLAVNADAKAKNIKSRKTYAVLTFFFPLIAGIVYACTRKNAQRLDTPPLENAQKLAKNSIIFFVVAVIIYVCSFGFGIYVGATQLSNIDDLATVDTYDMQGNLIGNDEDMPLYDRDGNKYILVEEITDDDYISYYENETTKEQYDSILVYIDEEGYFYFDEEGNIDMNDDGDFVDKDGKKYYSANTMYWDENGQLKDYFDAIF